MLKRPLVPADFARLRVYAPLVKIIVEPPEISIKDVLSPFVWSPFREYDIGSLFDLSSVHYIRQSPLEETQQWADPIHHFIGPSLVRFSLTLQGGHDYDDLMEDPTGLLEAQPGSVLLDIIAHPSSHCPQLHTFELDTTPFPFYAANALSDAVCRWSHLRSFEAYTCPLMPEAWRHLAALPSLCLLNALVDLPEEALSEVLLPSPQDPLVFRALRKLVLHAHQLKTCTILIKAIKSTTLAKVSLSAYGHACSADIESVCSALATCASRDALHELPIKPGCTNHGPHPHEPLPQAVLTALLALGPLQKLFLQGPCFSSLHNATLAAMVRAFPNLWTAMLCPDAAPQQGVTLAGLGVLVGLKELRSVHVPLADVDERALADAFSRQGAPPSSLPPGPSRPCSSASTAHGFSASALPVTTVSAPSRPSLVRSINVGRARVFEACVEGATAALSAWFPYLMSANFIAVDPDSDEPVLRAMGFRDGDEVVEVKRRWQRVGSAVRPFVLVRKQERRWAADNRSSHLTEGL